MRLGRAIDIRELGYGEVYNIVRDDKSDDTFSGNANFVIGPDCGIEPSCTIIYKDDFMVATRVPDEEENNELVYKSELELYDDNICVKYIITVTFRKDMLEDEISTTIKYEKYED